MYNEKYPKTKIKTYQRKINISFHDNIIPKGGFHCIFLLIILIDSVFKVGKNYGKVFLKELLKK